MKSKGLYICLVILGGLIVITLIHREWKKPPKSVRLLSDFGEIEKVVLNREDSTITMERVRGEWRIAFPIDYPADKEVVTELIDALNRMELGEIVTRRPEMHETFTVDDEKGTQISLCTSSDSISLIIGKAVGFGEGYLRFSEEDVVYLAKNFPRYSISKGLDYWREKSILSIPKEDVERIDFIYPTERFSLFKEEERWKLDGADVDSNKILPILTTLENFRADGFLYEGEFAQEVAIDLKLVDDSHEKILIGTPTDHRYPIVLEGTETVFLVNTWKVDRLKKKPADFQ